MARIFSLIFFIILLVLGLFFGVINADPVTLNYYWGVSQIPLSIIMVLCVLSGAVLGVLASLSLMVRLRHQISRLRREVKNAEKEVTNLRTLPLKDEH